MEDNKNDIPNEKFNEEQDNAADEESNDGLNTESEEIDFEEVTESKHCYNCNSVMSMEDKFCANCGQKHTTGKIPVWTFIYNFLQNTFNIDAKLPKTLGNLLIFPGRLTKEFFKGRHQSFLKPMQLFVFMTILCFTIIAFKASDLNTKFTVENEDNSFRTNFRFNEGENQIHFLLGMDTAKTITDSLLMIAKKELNSSKANAVLDTLFQPFISKDSLLNDSLTLPSSLRPGNEKTVKLSKKDLALYSEKDLVKLYKIEGFAPRLLFMQVLKTVKHEDQLANYFLSYLSWTFFLLVPFFALILKLVYIRRKMYYVEHLVFTLHFHAFAFTIISSVLLITNFTPLWVQIILFVYIPIYLFISMKLVYKQKVFKTLFKYILLIISYLILFVFALVITMGIAFVLF